MAKERKRKEKRRRSARERAGRGARLEIDDRENDAERVSIDNRSEGKKEIREHTRCDVMQIYASVKRLNASIFPGGLNARAHMRGTSEWKERNKKACQILQKVAVERTCRADHRSYTPRSRAA